METISGYCDLSGKFKKIAVALGTFDGIHLGHRKIIERVVEVAKQGKGISVVFTFEPHPRAILRPHLPADLITTYEEKQCILTALGVDILFTLPFNREFARMTPEQFVKDILVELMRPELLVVGPNYTFGCGGSGTPHLLSFLGEQNGFTVEVVKPVYIEGQMVSSTIIREMLSRGEVAAVRKYLDRYYTLSGRIVDGDRRGRLLGFPTANVNFPAVSVIPADGVYAVWVMLGRETYPGVANIGDNPTFKASRRRLEVHVLDYKNDLYGREMTVMFADRIREENVFNSSAELSAQIARDIQTVRNILQR